MLISGKSKLVKSPFTSEDELKKMVIENADYFFAPNSFCLSRELISDKDGFEAFTDGFVIDIASDCDGSTTALIYFPGYLIAEFLVATGNYNFCTLFGHALSNSLAYTFG